MDRRHSRIGDASIGQPKIIAHAEAFLKPLLLHTFRENRSNRPTICISDKITSAISNVVRYNPRY
jgi:hypothetical protein